ncbi:hypothetical protein EPI10_001834 [Gossypium australe]|uniref:Uncharacterized protein n=1 Tax=Gossypium australe TaxID=47621 RepID=A0A5B6VCU6_9ROSI|nr:hypothetical protein EPI10_001834 [Gossypium australe]
MASSREEIRPWLKDVMAPFNQLLLRSMESSIGWNQVEAHTHYPSLIRVKDLVILMLVINGINLYGYVNMLLPFNKFDVILGMDRITLHDNGETINVESDKLDRAANIIFSLSAQKLVRKG